MECEGKVGGGTNVKVLVYTSGMDLPREEGVDPPRSLVGVGLTSWVKTTRLS